MAKTKEAVNATTVYYPGFEEDLEWKLLKAFEADNHLFEAAIGEVVKHSATQDECVALTASFFKAHVAKVKEEVGLLGAKLQQEAANRFRKPTTKRERYACYRAILEKADNNELPGMLGPGVNVDELELYADLIDQGYLDGDARRSNGEPYNGRPYTVLGVRITAYGRDFLDELREAEQEVNRPVAVVHAQPVQESDGKSELDKTIFNFKNIRLLVVIIVVMGAIIYIATFAESLQKLWNTFNGNGSP